MKTKIENLPMGTSFVDVQGLSLTLKRKHASEGVFVAANAEGREYLYAGVAEVTIAPNAKRLCRLCEKEVTSPNPKVDVCRDCHYSGRADEDAHRALIDGLNRIDGVKMATIDHTGGGCFNLSVRLKDGRYVSVTENDGPGIPDAGDPWDFITIWRTEEQFCDGDAQLGFVEGGKWSDDQLVGVISDLIKNRPLTTTARDLHLSQTS